MPSSSPCAGYLGHGVNRVLDPLDGNSGPGPNRAVEGDEIAAGLGGGSRISICRTASELAQAMQRQSGGSLTGLGFLPLLGGKMAFYRSLQTTVFSLSVVVQAWRVSSAARLSQPHLAAGVAPPRTAAELQAFVQLYGDSYISAVELGGECLGVFTFRSETREQAERVERALQVGGLVSGIQLGADLHQTLENVSRSSAISLDFRYQIWGCSNAPALQPDTLVPYALGFNAQPLDGPIALDLACAGYETVAEIGQDFRPVAENRERFTGRTGLLRQRQRVQELINQIDSCQHTLTLYGFNPPEAEQLSRNRQQAVADRTALEALVEGYRAEPSAGLTPPTLASLALGSPKIRARVSEAAESHIGRTGTTQGQPFTVPFERETALQNQVRLAGIGLEAGWRVDKLRLRYSSTLTGAAPLEISHGGDRGINLGEISFGPGEGITGLYSEFGTNIDKLRLESDQGVLESSGDKGDKQHPLRWQPGPGEVVIGFSGRSDDDPAGAIHALQAVVARVDGIDWLPIDSVELNDA